MQKYFNQLPCRTQWRYPVHSSPRIVQEYLWAWSSPSRRWSEMQDESERKHGC